MRLRTPAEHRGHYGAWHLTAERQRREEAHALRVIVASYVAVIALAVAYSLLWWALSHGGH